MNTLLLEHFAAVSKIAAESQTREAQIGVSCVAGGFTLSNEYLRSVPCSIQVIFIPRQTIGAQTIFATATNSLSFRIGISSGVMQVYAGGTSVSLGAVVIDKVYDFVYTCDANTQSIYLDGELIASYDVGVSTLATYCLGYLAPTSLQYFKGDFCIHRHFDSVLSPAEVTTLHNNGDPLQYILPAMYKESPVIATPENWSYNGSHSGFDSTEEAVHITYPSYPIGIAYPTTISGDRFHQLGVKYTVRFKAKGSGSLRLCNVSYGLSEDSTKSIKVTNTYTDYEGVVRLVNSTGYVAFAAESRADIYIKDVEISSPLCIAEHLPQNLVADNNGLVSSWLDSAKQIPLNNKDLPPLLETAGGYDLFIVGSPKIIYKL